MKPPQWVQDLFAQKSRPLIVGEVKLRSPFNDYESDLPRRKALEYVESFADIVSIHTCEWWGGSFDWLCEARRATTKPVLAKGFHPTLMDYTRALSYGADYVLTVGWAYPYGSKCWHECATLDELINSPAKTVVWNARDPRMGDPNPVKIDVAARSKPIHAKLCQASCIRSREDIHPGVDLVLIGEGLYTGST